jgi:hypothetical protein
MQKMMMSIAETDGNAKNLNQIRQNKGTIIKTEKCDISSKESAEKTLKDFLDWEQDLCAALVKGG